MTDGRPNLTIQLNSILERYESPLLRYAARLTGDVESARDVVQDVFVRFCEADRASLDGRVEQWLFTVCRNRALDVRRKDGRMKLIADDKLAANSHATFNSTAKAEQSEQSQGMLQMLCTLPDNQQEALRLKFDGGLSYKAIANVLETTPGNVGVMIHAGLKKLREQLNPSETASPTTTANIKRFST